MQRKVSHSRASLSIPSVKFQMHAVLFLEYSCESSTLGNTVTTSTYAKRSNIVFR